MLLLPAANFSAHTGLVCHVLHFCDDFHNHEFSLPVGTTRLCQEVVYRFEEICFVPYDFCDFGGLLLQCDKPEISDVHHLLHT